MRLQQQQLNDKEANLGFISLMAAQSLRKQNAIKFFRSLLGDLTGNNKKKRKPVAYEVEYCGRRSVCNLPTLTVLFRDWVTVVKIDHNLLALKRFD